MNAIKRNKLLSLVIVFALSVGLVFGVLTMRPSTAAALESNVYYVAPGLEYGTTGTVNSRENPYEIVSLLNSTTLKPGDTVKVLPGDYDLTLRINVTVSGTYDKFITIENESDSEQATLKFYKQRFSSLNRGVTISGNYIRWNDVDVCGAGDNGLYIGGSYNIVENCEFYDNRDSGLQLGRASGDYNDISQWPSYNLIKNCTSHNNYDNETYGENADGFAAKLTIGYGNVFDGCVAYRNSDDGWDLYAKTDTGNIGAVIMYNCVAFENGFLEFSQKDCNAKFPEYNKEYDESDTESFNTRDGDGNGFKLGGSVMEGDVVLYNCLSFNNKYHGVTDNSNPGVISLKNVTSYDNNREVDAFGNVVKGLNSDLGGANIDLARQTYSYNNIANTVSVKSTDAKVSNDAYRASVQNSVFRLSDGYVVEGSLDADTKQGINGKKEKALTEAVFASLPIDYSSSTYNFTGVKDFALGENRIHVKYRNTDGSLNLGSLLTVKNQPINGVLVGADFNKQSYDEYEHFQFDGDYSDCNDETEAILSAASKSLTIACNKDAVYQDFWVPVNMKNVEIKWTSSDVTVLDVREKDKEIPQASGAKFSYVTVKRDISEDKEVTLTATITKNGSSIDKSFRLNVKADEPRIGDVFVTYKGKKIYDGDNFIVNQYSITEEPEILVVNGANYSGSQFVKGSQYQSETTYEYATSKLSNFVEVKEFTPSNAGVWHITHKITLVQSKEERTYGYYVYVASETASVDFTGEPSVSVNRDGYLVSGELSNVTGYIYALSSATEIDVTAQNIKTLEGVREYGFTSDVISFQFENANKGGYHVYYALANARGQITSKIYHDEISMIEISDNQAFMKVANGEKIENENVSQTVYSLTACLDFSDTVWTTGGGAFKGYLIGNGHTVKNVKVKGSGLFAKVEGATIADINFDNVVIDNASGQKNGIISSVYGGTFENIKITRIKVVGGQRTGAFIGQIFEGKVATVVSKVSVVNPELTVNADGTVDNLDDGYYVKANGTRASSLIGFIQPTADPVYGVKVYVSDCYTDVYTWATSYSVSGIVAEYDDAKGATTDLEFLLDIRNCYTASTLVATGSSSRMGGMLGYHKGGGTLVISGCFSTMEAYFAKLKVDVAQKNISAIMGNCASTGETVNRCATLMEEYNSDYGVTAYSESMLTGSYGKSVMYDTVGFNPEVWELCYGEGGNGLVKPYVRLNYSSCVC